MQETGKMRPTSIHQWRNCVSASIALNYAHEGEFFHPRTHNMQVDDYQSDVTITEFPLLYYVIGMLYRVFGFHEWIYKLVNILIGFTGLFFLYRLGLRAFKKITYALFLPMLVFSSPIYVYYINNFIPDATSLSIALIGFYYFYRYIESRERTFFYISMAILAFAGLNKTPALLLYFAIFGLFFFERVFQVKYTTEDKVFTAWGKLMAGFVGVMIIIIAWYAYAKIYTDIHGGVVSLVEIRPIWRLSDETIRVTWEEMTKRFWKGNYHTPVILILTIILFIFNLVRWKKHNPLYSILNILILLGAISFTMLFYRSMRNHDYYQMNNLIFPVLVFFNFLLYLQQNHIKLYRSILLKSTSIILMVFMVLSGSNLLRTKYYSGWYMKYSWQEYNNRYDQITPVLRDLGIERTDKVYCTPDGSINISLYLMDQKGFTDFYRRDRSFSEKLAFFRTKGCKYLITGTREHLDIQPEDLGMVKIGEYHGAEIFAFKDDL